MSYNNGRKLVPVAGNINDLFRILNSIRKNENKDHPNYDSNNISTTTEENPAYKINYDDKEYEDTLPECLRDHLYDERLNNKCLLDALMEVERKSLEQIANIEYTTRKIQYEAILEYMTEAGAHRADAIMCSIINKTNK